MRKEQIRKTLREMIQDNVICLMLKGQSAECYHQNQNPFLYLEIKATSPRIRYIYDLTRAVFVGRDKTENQICIYDLTVSRHQGKIWAENGSVYYADEKDARNPVSIRRGVWSVKLQPGERLRLKTGDCLTVGTVKMKIRLFAGEQELL